MMLALSLVQVVFAIGATVLGARLAMRYGRDLRAQVFAHVQGFSLHEMNRFGTPSLIARSTNDVLQLQTALLMILTMIVNAPLMALGGVVMAVQQDPHLSLLLAVSMPVMLLAVALLMSRTILHFSADAGADRPGESDPARADHRPARNSRLRARHVRKPTLRRGQRHLDRDGPAYRTADGRHDSHSGAGDALVYHRAGLVSVRAHGRGHDTGGFAGGLPGLCGADPDVGDDGGAAVRCSAARAGLRQADRGGSGYTALGRRAGGAKGLASGTGPQGPGWQRCGVFERRLSVSGRCRASAA